MRIDLKEELLDRFDSIISSKLFYPYLIYVWMIVLSFVIPEHYIFPDESSLPLKTILIYGSFFYLVGWMYGAMKIR